MVASKIVALCALFAAAVSAQDIEYNKRVAVNEFWKRAAQSQFTAAQDTKAGSDCVAAFGQGYVTCREKSATEIRLCYNPSIGQVCCQNAWGCPADSYCLVNNLCCPTGADPGTCAGAYSVGLPSSLSTADSGPAPSTSSPAPPPVSSWTSTYTYTASIAITTKSLNSMPSVEAAGYDTSSPLPPTCLGTAPIVTSSVTIVPVPLHTANSTIPVGTTAAYTAPVGPTQPATTTSKLPVYTGAAASNSQVGAWTGLAAFLALAGLL